MSKTVANIANLISFSFTTSRSYAKLTLTQSVDVGGSITIANGFFSISSRRLRATGLHKQAKLFKMKFSTRSNQVGKIVCLSSQSRR